MRVGTRLFLTSLATVGIALTALPGCGDGGGPKVDTSATEVKLTGTILVKGKPAKGGKVTFDPGNNYQRTFQSRDAPIKDDGTYEITTMTGENLVNVNTPDTAKDPSLGYVNQKVDIKPGTTTLDIHVPPDSTSAPAPTAK